MEEFPEEQVIEEKKNEISYGIKEPTSGKKVLTRIERENETEHFPFRIEEGELINKYEKLNSIVYQDFSKLPSGFIKSPKKGYGFTKQLSSIIFFADKYFEGFKKIVITKKNKSQYSKGVLTLNYAELEEYRKRVSSIMTNFFEEKRVFTNNFFSQIFPDNFPSEIPKYRKGLFRNVIEEKKDIIKNLSPDDKKSLFDLFKKCSFSKDNFINNKSIISTKREVDIIYIEKVFEIFTHLMNLRRIGEPKWQEFFKENSWIFSQLFGFPAIMLTGEGFIGGGSIGNDNKKIADFIYENKLSKNVAIIEIKKNNTDLLKVKKPYRGKDVFKISEELNGGINQVLNQKHNLQKNYPEIKEDSEEEFEVFNPKCILICGNNKDLKKFENKSFELFRTSLKDVEIITFNELYEKIDLILKIFTKQDKVKTENGNKNKH